ncbi:MAG: 2-dehydro-3-deoxygalactonokinase DgoK [Rhodobacteraceae bacterium HLUCCA08]|nr:MAG: 2-dehydro-3-deoxygalactonokinase DgoK [Rhodobacteraceae bacterium HLUCCA08]
MTEPAKDTPDWVAADWGSSHLRLWLMAGPARVLARIDSDAGMAGLARDEYEPTLIGLLGDALPQGRALPVIVCGMAGSRQGWAEAPYAKAPCAPPSLSRATRVATAEPRLSVHILPGIRQDSPADVMRGEETQIAGLLAARPEFDGIACLPGTHTKWARISAGEVVSFRTFMTGELFDLLSTRSVLRHSVAGTGWDAPAFDAAVSDALSRPADIAARLFALRAEALLQDLAPQVARARLSGLLIGIELAAARPYWLGQQVVVLGADAIAGAYGAALRAQGVPAETADAEALTLAGLAAAHTHLRKVQPWPAN